MFEGIRELKINDKEFIFKKFKKVFNRMLIQELVRTILKLLQNNFRTNFSFIIFDKFINYR